MGGAGSYQFDWDNGETTEDLTAIAAGNYQVTVTDANGCTATTSESIGENMAIASQLTQTGVNCLGGSDGSIGTSVSGGSGVFSYAWAGPNGFSSTQQNPDSLVAGQYFVTISDVVGCAVWTLSSLPKSRRLLPNWA